MLYYLGKGTEFKKEDCKEYKKLDAALKAAAKDESLVVWDETGKVIGSLTDDIPEGALQTNPDGSVNTYDADGNKTGTVDAETLKEMTTVNDDVSKLATGDNEQGTPQENAEDDENASNEDKATNPPTEQENGREWGKYRATGGRGRAGGQSHHPAGKNESDGHCFTFGSTGQAKRNRSFTITNIIIRMTNLRKECRW